MKVHQIIYTLEQKDICDYNHRCLVSSGLMFPDIIMNMIRNKVLEYYVVLVDRYFTNMENKIIYMYRGSFQYFYWKKGTHETLDVICPHFNYEIIKMRQYFSNILKCDTSSDDMKKRIDHWLDYFEKFHKHYIIMPTKS